MKNLLIFSIIACICALTVSGSKPAPEGIAFLGDSNLWQGGDDCSRRQAWSYWWNPLPDTRESDSGRGNDFVKRSFARSGATITNTPATPADTTAYSEVLSDDNTLFPQALRLKGAVERGDFPMPSVIFISAGTNDAWFAQRRPGLFEPDSGNDMTLTASTPPGEATTLRRALKLLIRTLRNIAPDSRIVVVGPPFLTRTSRQMVTDVARAIEEVALAENIEFIALDNDSIINPDCERMTPILTRDGVHTSTEGARRIAMHIRKSLSNFATDMDTQQH